MPLDLSKMLKNQQKSVNTKNIQGEDYLQTFISGLRSLQEYEESAQRAWREYSDYKGNKEEKDARQERWHKAKNSIAEKEKVAFGVMWDAMKVGQEYSLLKICHELVAFPEKMEEFKLNPSSEKIKDFLRIATRNGAILFGQGEELLMNHPEFYFGSKYCHYVACALPKEVDTYDVNFIKEGTEQSHWRMSMLHNVEEFEAFRKGGDIYWDKRVNESKDKTGKIKEELVEALAQEAAEFMLEEDNLIYRAVVYNTNITKANPQKKDKWEIDRVNKEKAEAEKALIGLEAMPRYHEYSGIIEIYKRQQELAKDREIKAEKAAAEKHKQLEQETQIEWL